MAEGHWKLGRNRQRGLSESAEAAAAATEQVIAVGEILRRQREERGLDLRHVSESLHIRYPYLQAIENSLIDELPGPTYALGFVKAYAEHLGLDSDTVVERFKAEQRGLSSTTQLVFPSPLPEGKVPSVAVLVVAAMLAVAAYSGWMYFSDSGEQVAEVVPPLPEKVREIAEQNKVVPPPAAEPVHNEQVAAKAAEPPAPIETTIDTETEPPVEQGSADTDTPATDAAVEPQTADTAPTEIASAPPATSLEPEQSVATETPAEAPKAETAPRSAVIQEREPVVYGDEAGGGRIVMRAIGATWVEIRDEDKNEVLLTRVLYTGDQYYMPDREGLVLLTGNAGGIEISVDGEKVPAIGPKGAVRRNVLLDPVALKAGKAVQDLPAESQQQSDATVKPTQ